MFPDDEDHEMTYVVRRALDRLEHCFSRVTFPSYRRNGKVFFNHLHSEQYACFLYFASNTAWKDIGDINLATKLFLLNKAINGMICMYDTELPDIFLIVHSVGIMLGKAKYSDYLVVYQNVTVGSDRGHQPRLGDGVVICAGSAVIGDCDLGANVSVSVNTTVLNTNVPSEHIVAGRSPNLIVKPATRALVKECFDVG